jgi:hypothetical protein
MNKDAVKWTSVDRTVGSETAPSIDEILLVRKPPTPGGNAPVDPPKDDK